MDTQAFPLGTVAKGGKRMYLFWNQPVLPSKTSEKPSCFSKARSSLYFKFYCSGSFWQNYCGSLLSLLSPPWDTQKEGKNLTLCCHPGCSQIRNTQGDGMDFPGSQEAALTDTIPHKIPYTDFDNPHLSESFHPHFCANLGLFSNK